MQKNKIGYLFGAIVLFLSNGGYLDLFLREIIPFSGILFLMIAYPSGLAYVWKKAPDISTALRFSMILSAIVLELTLPMALPYEVGANYRSLWGDVWSEIKGLIF